MKAEKQVYKPFRHEFDSMEGLKLKIDDLKELQRIRYDHEESIDSNIYMLVLFATLEINLNIDPQQIMKDAIRFSEGFKNTLSVNKIMEYISPFFNIELKYLSSYTIIQTLNINSIEQKSMKIIIEKKEKNRRSNYKRDELNRILKFVRKKLLKDQILRLRNEGKTMDEIELITGIKKRTLYNNM